MTGLFTCVAALVDYFPLVMGDNFTFYLKCDNSHRRAGQTFTVLTGTYILSIINPGIKEPNSTCQIVIHMKAVVK